MKPILIFTGSVASELGEFTTKSGKSGIGFTLESTNPGDKYPSRVSVECYGRQAEFAKQFCARGEIVNVIGEARASTYEYQQKTRAKLSVFATALQLVTAERERPSQAPQGPISDDCVPPRQDTGNDGRGEQLPF